MTVFVTHAPADRESAEGLEKVIERRGQFCELDDGEAALPPVQSADVVVLLLSKDFVFAPTRLRLEQRALDAWSEGRLITVRLDKGLAPVGLRDLPTIDASFAAQREFAWAKVADAVRERLKGAAAGPDGGAPPVRTASKRGGGGILAALALLLLTLPGLGAAAALAGIWLVNRIGPTPGGWPELRAGIDALGGRVGLPGLVTETLFAAALALTLAIIGFALAGLVRRSKPRRAAPAARDAAAPPEGAVFVSYASANRSAVLPVIQAATRDGGAFWLDRNGISAGETWAGEIVRAIRSAADVVVMCSKAAFESDHVKREIYLADRYQKRLVPVFIEEATPPEDFEYFFAGVQFLKLFETPEAERPKALLNVLGASS